MNAEQFRTVIWFVFAVWIGLMVAPKEIVMWGLIVVAVGVILFRSDSLTAA